jgi:hypothetical protein
MLDLLKIEWLKVRKYKAFIILSIFFVLGIAASNYIVYLVSDNIINKSEAAILLNKFSPYDFEHVWQTVSYTSGYLLILPSMLLLILMTNEFTFKTNRQNIIDGWNRTEFIDVKLLIAMLIAVITTLLVIITGLCFALYTKTTFSLHGFSHVGYFFLKSLTYFLFAILISVLIKKTGFAIGVFFIYLGAENILAQALDFLSIKLKSNNNVDLGSMGDYLPMNAADGLLTFPENPLKSMARSSLPTDYSWLVLCFTIVYIILFFWLSRNRIIKKDL